MAVLRKIVTKVLLPVGTVVSVPLIVPLIYAEDTKSSGKLVKPSDLPIYDSPKKTIEEDIAEAKQSVLEQGISSIRQSLFSKLDSFEETKEKVEQFLQKSRQKTEGAVEYIREEKNVVPRAVLITLSGLGGLLLGARGGFTKKVFYSSGGIVLMSSICYPQQAVQISQDAYKIGKYYSIITYNKVFDQRSGKALSSPPPSSTPLDTLAEQASDVQYYGFRLEEHKKLPPETNEIVKECEDSDETFHHCECETSKSQ